MFGAGHGGRGMLERPNMKDPSSNLPMLNVSMLNPSSLNPHTPPFEGGIEEIASILYLQFLNLP